MITLIKAIFAIVIIALFLAVWRIESKWRFVFTPFLLLMYWEFVRVLPAFFLADNYGIASNLIPLAVAVTAFVALVTGFVCAYFALSTTPNRVLNLNLPKTQKLHNKGEGKAVLVLAFFLFALGLYFYKGLPATIHAVLGLLPGGAGDELARFVSSQRLELTKGAYFGAEYKGQGLIRAVQQVGWGLICSYSLINAVQAKSVKRWIPFALSFFLAWLYIGGTGARGPFLNLLIVIIAAYSMYRALSLRFIVFAACGMFALAIFLSLYSMKMYSILMDPSRSFLIEASSKIASRIFLGNALNDVRVIELISTGEWTPRLGWNHFRDFVTSLPGVQYGKPLGYELYTYLNPGSKQTTFATGTYIMDVYCDFSWYGIFPVFFVAGCFVGLMQRCIFTFKPNPWSISVAAVIGFYSARVVGSGFSSVISNFVVLAFLIFVHYTISIVFRNISFLPVMKKYCYRQEAEGI